MEIASENPIPISPNAGEFNTAIVPSCRVEAAGNLARAHHVINSIVSERTNEHARNVEDAARLLEIIHVKFRDEVGEGGKALPLLLRHPARAALGRVDGLTVGVEQHARAI